MTISRVYTVNGIEYKDLKDAKAASAKIELVALFGEEMANQIIANANKLVPMLHSLKTKKVKAPKAVVVADVKAPKTPKNKKAEAVVAVAKSA